MKKLKCLRCLSLMILFIFYQSSLAKAQENGHSKPWVFWYWIKAAVSKPGITADLEAMKANGIGGAYLMTIQGSEKSPLYTPASVQLTPEWWQMVDFAMTEAARLDLKLGMHVSDGFALAGGPWVTPELSMQKLVWSTLNINNSKNKIVLNQPESIANYYKDIAVYAYPTPSGVAVSTRTVKPIITVSNGSDAKGLIIPNNKQNFSANQRCYIQYEFNQPFTCRSICIKVAGNNYQAQRLGVEVSNDGKSFSSIGRLVPPRHGWQDTDQDVTHSIAPVTAKFFRFLYDPKGSEPGAEDLDAAKWKPNLKLINLELFSEAKINQFEGKNGSVWRISERGTSKQISKELCVPLNKIINLTAKLMPDGSLNWTPPAGNWTILRIGHTSTGHTNATAGGGMGLECDKFNPDAVRTQFKNWYGQAIKHAESLGAKKVLSVFHVDSWECGSQNWSPVFKAEFLKRRGYDITPYLPAMTGLPVEDVTVSENFLYDVRKTISELIVDQFYKTLSGLAKENGVSFTAESVAPTMLSDGLMHYKIVDVPMGEFWLNSPTHDKPNDMLDAISGAHIYGKNVVQAEAFTAVRMDWNESPANMKTLQDRNYALGINRLVYHVFTHNPWMDRKPGMTLDGVGLYFQRDQTWWKLGKAWVGYAERCQNLLQQGKPVTDIAVFTGEELPRRAVLPNRLVQTLPGIFGKTMVEREMKRLSNVNEPLRQIPMGVTHSANMADPQDWINPLKGYTYDSFNPDVLSTAYVENGNVVFAGGATYKMLVFTGQLSQNPNYSYVSYQTVKKLAELVKEGASVIIAEKPMSQPGLVQAEAADFNKAVNEIWDGEFRPMKKGDQPMLLKKLGLGTICKAPIYSSDFSGIGINRDLIALDRLHRNNIDAYAGQVAFAHRRSAGKDIYFISNQQSAERILRLSFAVTGRTPIVYDAVADRKIPILNWSGTDDRTSFELKFEPNESLFIIFETTTTEKAGPGGKNWMDFKIIKDISKSWHVNFDTTYGGRAKPILFDSLLDWSKSEDSLVKYYSGTAVYAKEFTFNGSLKERLWLDLGEFSVIARVTINGVDCGTLWTAPHRVEISRALKIGVNRVTIEIANTWANRLIGDQKLSEDERITKTTAPFRLADRPLNPAGLIGPVTIQTEDK